MPPEASVKLSSLYDTDYHLWIEKTVAQLRTQEFRGLDLENLIEEVESLSRSEKHAISSYLMRLCEHLLKLKYWASERERCFRGWVLEMNNFRSEIEWILQDSPSLNPFLQERFLQVYQKARKNLLKVLQLPTDAIPEAPEFSLEEALDEDWLPWQPNSTLNG